MIIDSSVLIAILQLEAGFEKFLEAISQADIRRIAAPALLETSMVIAGRKGEAGLDGLDAFVREAEIEVIPFTIDHLAVARKAFLRYGKGRHAAALNFGDCISYATAWVEGFPLLFKGDDFPQTDIPAVL